MTKRVSRRELNHSKDRHSSQDLPLKLSPVPFCQDLPGSLNEVLMPAWATHSRLADQARKHLDAQRRLGQELLWA